MNGLFPFPVSPRLLVLMGTFSFTLYFSDIKLSFKQNNWKNHPLFLLGLGVKRGNTEMENWKILLERRLMHFWGQNHLILWSLSLTSQSDFYSIFALINYTASESHFLHLVSEDNSTLPHDSWAVRHWTKNWQMCVQTMRRRHFRRGCSYIGLLCSLVTNASRNTGIFFSYPLRWFKSKLNLGWKLVPNLPFVHRIDF